MSVKLLAPVANICMDMERDCVAGLIQMSSVSSILQVRPFYKIRF